MRYIYNDFIVYTRIVFHFQTRKTLDYNRFVNNLQTTSDPMDYVFMTIRLLTTKIIIQLTYANHPNGI